MLTQRLTEVRMRHASKSESMALRDHVADDCHDEIHAILSSKAFQRWDLPLSDIVTTIAAYNRVTLKRREVLTNGKLKQMFDMDRETVPQFLIEGLGVSRNVAEEWARMLWMDRLRM